uniref:Ubiquitin-like protease family profile domain-containing protein n=1 Tax=Brassica oleracea var. oleracea TaxID=109376 RepID=A0A0D2ZXY1_BRAOL
MFVAPWFTAHMQGKGRSFKAARRKTGVAGDAKITNYLTRPRQRWGMEVDRLYTPMIWGGTHWVGLCISLSDWAIYVFDPNPLGKTIEQVEELLEPVSTMLPYVAKKVCPAAAVGERAQVPFRVERVTGLYVNRRSGDCGPVAVKFLEMHATGDRKPTMAGLTDDLVDIFRKHYAMDIYRGVVVPLYLR